MQTWPNFGTEGVAPALGTYRAAPLPCDNITAFADEPVGPFRLGAQLLSHGRAANGSELLSTAFLLQLDTPAGPRQLL